MPAPKNKRTSTAEQPQAPAGGEVVDAPEGSLYAWAFDEPALRLGRRSRWILLLLLVVSGVYSLLQGSFLPTALFFLIGLIGWRVSRAAPRAFRCFLTGEGLYLNTEFFPYERMQSFWIFPGHEPVLSLQQGSGLVRQVRAPFPADDVERVRSVLLQFLPEEEQEVPLVDSLEKLLHS